jgi:hypothetical protein
MKQWHRVLMCGRDLSAVIDKSPHGRSKLQTLTVVGQLTS